MPDLLGVVLAGGQSRRMGGGDKAVMRLGTQSLLAHVTDRFRVQLPDIILNANRDFRGEAGVDLPLVADLDDGYLGPLSGVLAGLTYARDAGASAIVTVATDTPFFPEDLVERLTTSAAASDSALALAATQGEGRMLRHPTFGYWPVALRDDLAEALQGGVRKVVQWTDRHDCSICEFPVAEFDPFFNVNTPEDLERARLILAEQAA